jgi:hypothetical protein
MTALRLSGPEQRELQKLLAEAFDPEEFRQFLRYRLDLQLHDIAGAADNFQTVLFKVLERARRRLWWRDLLVEARNELPDDPGLLAFAERFGLAPTVAIAGDGGRVPHGDRAADLRQLELKIREAGCTFDIVQWRRRLGAIEGRVCRVEFPEGEARGTGFLVGPATVITNYHVMEPVVDGRIGARHVALRFDYKKSTDGTTVRPGKVYELAADWRIDSSPYSQVDSVSEPRADPAPDELDYALVRVAGEPGDDPVGGETDDPAAKPRGWIEAPAEEHDFDRNPALYIVQHPDGRAMEVAVDSNAVLGCNGNATRVRYTTTTEPGSSGSPCFGADWQWVALHQSGDPKYWQGGQATYNQGVPLAAIRRLTAARGTGWAFAR